VVDLYRVRILAVQVVVASGDISSGNLPSILGSLAALTRGATPPGFFQIEFFDI
jgi:hypothetical protein